jgi:hypothetical protein
MNERQVVEALSMFRKECDWLYADWPTLGPPWKQIVDLAQKFANSCTETKA